MFALVVPFIYLCDVFQRIQKRIRIADFFYLCFPFYFYRQIFRSQNCFISFINYYQKQCGNMIVSVHFILNLIYEFVKKKSPYLLLFFLVLHALNRVFFIIHLHVEEGLFGFFLFLFLLFSFIPFLSFRCFYLSIMPFTDLMIILFFTCFVFVVVVVVFCFLFFYFFPFLSPSKSLSLLSFLFFSFHFISFHFFFWKCIFLCIYLHESTLCL